MTRRVPKKIPFAVLLLGAVLSVGVAAAEEAEVEYLEGYPELRTSGGTTRELDFGDRVRPGESVRTGPHDLVELRLPGGNLATVHPETVFRIDRYADDEGEKENTGYSNARGHVRYRIDQLTGREQRVGTGTAVAGVRGTEFDVFAGDDGTALFAVERGVIAVRGATEEVELRDGQGVEVRPGLEPGEPVEVDRDVLDFSDWNAERTRAVLDDPLGSIQAVRTRMEQLAAELRPWEEAWRESRERLEELRQERRRIEAEEGREPANEFYREEVLPKEVRTSNLRLNVRYWTLSALSLRRHVAGRIYVLVRTRYITRPDRELYRNYIEEHERTVEYFRDVFVPHLSRLDI